MKFFVAGVCAVKGNSKKIAKFGSRYALIGDERARNAEAELVGRMREHRPLAPFSGPVKLDVVFVLPIPAGWAAWKKRAAAGRRYLPVGRKDRGNMLKLVEDALEAYHVTNDAHIVRGNVEKVYGETPGYEIVLEELPQATRESERTAILTTCDYCDQPSLMVDHDGACPACSERS